MHQKLELLVDDLARSDSPPPRSFDYIVGEDEIEIAFLREKQRRMPS